MAAFGRFCQQDPLARDAELLRQAPQMQALAIPGYLLRNTWFTLLQGGRGLPEFAVSTTNQMTYAGLAGCVSKQQLALHNHRVLFAIWCQQEECWWIEAVRGIGKLGGQKPLQQAPNVLRGDLHVPTCNFTGTWV